MYVYKLDKTIDRFPFQTLENTDSIPTGFYKLVGINGDNAIIVTDISLDYGIIPDTLDGFYNIKNKNQLTKADIVNSAYTTDQETKILRDAQAGRNLDIFSIYDSFVESIPGA